MSSVNVEYLQSVLKGLAEAGSKLTADHNDLIERFNHLSRAVDTLIQNDKINDQRFEAQNKAMMEMQQRVQKMELFLHQHSIEHAQDARIQEILARESRTTAQSVTKSPPPPPHHFSSPPTQQHHTANAPQHQPQPTDFSAPEYPSDAVEAPTYAPIPGVLSHIPELQGQSKSPSGSGRRGFRFTGFS